MGFAVGVGLQALLVQRVRGENHVDYKYEDYSEESGRIHVRTHGALFEIEASSSVSVHGELVFDLGRDADGWSAAGRQQACAAGDDG